MSRHLHHAISSDVEHVLHDINHLSAEEVETLYGIVVEEAGIVFDPVENKRFSSISEWAEFEAELDEMEFSESFGHGKQEYGDDR